MNPYIDAGESAADLSKTLFESIEKFFSGPDQDEKIAAFLLSLYGSGIPQGIYASVKLAYFIEKQISTYLSQLGADVAAVEKFAGEAGNTILRTASNPANPGSSTSRPSELTGKDAECAASGGFMLFGECIRL